MDALADIRAVDGSARPIRDAVDAGIGVEARIVTGWSPRMVIDRSAFSAFESCQVLPAHVHQPPVRSLLRLARMPQERRAASPIPQHPSVGCPGPLRAVLRLSDGPASRSCRLCSSLLCRAGSPGVAALLGSLCTFHQAPDSSVQIRSLKTRVTTKTCLFRRRRGLSLTSTTS